MWVGCVAGEGLAWTVHGGASACTGVGAAVSGMIALAIVGRRWPGIRGLVALLIAGAVTGACVSALQGARWHVQSETVADCGAREWVGVVEADPIQGRFGSTVRVRIRGGPLDGARVRVYWPAEEAVPDLGRTVRFSAVLRQVSTEEAWGRRVARTGAVALGTAWRAETGAWRCGVTGPLFAWRARVLARMHHIGGAGGDLLEGIVLGDRRRLADTPADEDFRVLGLTHLVAVSGSHLALACAAVAVVGGALRVPRRPLVLATLAAGAAYAAVTGMAFAALRSLMMLGVGSMGALSGRRGDGIASLGAGVIAVLAVEPWSVYDIGLQLSVLAVGSLLLFGALATAWAEAGVPRWGRTVAGPIALTLVAQVVTVPVIASCFGMVSLLAPLANAYAGPMVSLALWAGLAGAVVVELVAPVGTWLMQSSAAVLQATAWIAAWMASAPGAAIAMGSGILLVLVPVGAAVTAWVVWPLPRSIAGARAVVASAVALTIAAAVGPAGSRQASLVVLDVGQGDAILLRDGGRTMLVDGGPDEVSLRRALARHGVRRIDVLVLTHAHDDHTGGVPGLAQVADIGWTGYPAIDSDHFAWVDPRQGGASGFGDPRALAAGDTWRVGGTFVTVLWPPRECADELGTNDTSVILRLERGGFDAILAGDAERSALEGAASGFGLEPVEVLKVPHHGSENGLTLEALALLSARDALISVGTGNDFGHPDASTLSMLEESGCRVWRTDISGDLTVRVRKNGYGVTGSVHGMPGALRARMDTLPRQRCVCASLAWSSREAMHGGQGARGSQAGLPHLRRGRAAAGARAPPAPQPHRRSRRSHVQLRGVRR